MEEDLLGLEVEEHEGQFRVVDSNGKVWATNKAKGRAVWSAVHRVNRSTHLFLGQHLSGLCGASKND